MGIALSVVDFFYVVWKRRRRRRRRNQDPGYILRENRRICSGAHIFQKSKSRLGSDVKQFIY
jgi:hypothetical protein